MTAPTNLFRCSDLQPRVHLDVPSRSESSEANKQSAKGHPTAPQAEQRLLAVGSVKLSISKQSKNKKRSERGREKKETNKGDSVVYVTFL